MIKQKTLDFCLDQLLGDTAKAYFDTEESCLLREKLAQMDRDCDCMLTPDQKKFVLECFDLLSDMHGRRERFFYRHGILDCTCLLQAVGVL